MHNERKAALNDQLFEILKEGVKAEFGKVDAFLKTEAKPFYNSEILPRFVEPVWECSDDIVQLLITTFPEVLGLPDHNFQTALGKAIEYSKLELLEYFGEPGELKGAVFQWIMSSSEKCATREKISELRTIYEFIGHENFIDEYYDANDLLNQVGFQIDDLRSQVVQERHQIAINLNSYKARYNIDWLEVTEEVFDQKK